MVFVERCKEALVLTERDSQIVAWIGALGAAGAEHVMVRFGMGRSLAYRRLGRLVEWGLLELRRLLYGRPGLYVATRQGLRWRGLDGLGVFRVGPGGFEHAWKVAGVAVALSVGLPGWRVLSERELRWCEREQQELVGSVRVGRFVGAAAALHRPDLVLIAPGGRVVAVEVELSVKARSRLLVICRGWTRARHVDAVYYLATAAAAGAVARAVAQTRAGDRVAVLALGDGRELVARELGGAGDEHR
jgi:hypothetical protein